MEKSQLRSFLKVAELGSFTKAAEALFFSQPAVTQQIQSLIVARQLGKTSAELK